jgi:hypothetical protein
VIPEESAERLKASTLIAKPVEIIGKAAGETALQRGHYDIAFPTRISDHYGGVARHYLVEQ